MKNKILGIFATVVLALSTWIGSHSFAQAPQNAAVPTVQGTGLCGQMDPCGPGIRMEQGREKHFGQNSLDNQIAIADDVRQFVEMPEMAKKIMRQRMLSNFIALNQILGLLAENKLKDAAKIAEIQICDRRIGAGTGMGPGKFMPIEMRKIGMSMHKLVDEFARIARTGETTKAYATLQKYHHSLCGLSLFLSHTVVLFI